MRRLGILVCAAALVGLVQLPVAGQEKKELPRVIERAVVQPCCPPGHSFKHMDGRPLVIIVNGAGGSTTASDNLIEVNGELQLGLRMQPISWNRHNSVFKDLVDTEAQINAAGRIACTVAGIRRDCPNLPIFLVGYSAGARVVLAAGEMLPDKSLERIILLSPAVSWTYDLTGALRASRGGVVNFWSGDDSSLDHAVDHVGTADGKKTPAAGSRGFKLPCGDKEYLDAYRNVRQVRWNEEYCGGGGHSCWVLRHNLKKGVVPVFFAPAIVWDTPVEIRTMPPANWSSPPLPGIRTMPPAK